MELINFSKKLILFNTPLSTMGYNSMRVMQQLLLRSASTEPKKIEEATYAIMEEEEDTISEREQKLEQSRDKSRLKEQHRNMLHNKVPYTEPMDPVHLTLRYKRMMFGRYGHQSNINPGTLWPNAGDLKKIMEFEKIAFPYSIQESISKQRRKIEEENRLIEERQAKLMKNIQKLDQWKKEMEARIAKKLAQEAKAKAKKDALIDEVKKHFGYKVEMHEERFKEMLLLKEKAMKKKMKEEKAKAKHEKLLVEMLNKES